MRFHRFAIVALAMALLLSGNANAAASDPLAKWFGSQTCPALDGVYSSDKKIRPPVKTGLETLVVDVPNEVAAAIVFLLSDAAAAFAGQTLHPNGGELMV